MTRLEHTTVNLGVLSRRTGLTVLGHLEREVAVPVLEGIQAQGDLIVIPLPLVAVAVSLTNGRHWLQVPATGLELLRSAAGGNPHTLVADRGACEYLPSPDDTLGLALGVFQCSAPVYLLHPEHGATGFTPGAYVVRRQREYDHRRRTWSGGAHRLVAD
ncbi:hypothetical protein [Nonomuraea typhae]|uniref:hypothetical protein n=1 Tax=Nonomuraea typhae TaxID=2603600 RepID=UPI0012FCECD4|nr:hypothetical protein [Nonomuraea typhae]